MSDPFERLLSIAWEDEDAMIVLYEGGRDMGKEVIEADALEEEGGAEVELRL